MITRHINWLFLAGFVLVGIVYLYQSFGIVAANPSAGYGPVQFPLVVGALLIILCVAQAVVMIRGSDPEEDTRLAIPNAGKLVGTVILAGLYFLAWELTSQFYIVTGVFYFLLAAYYQERPTLRSLAIAALIAVLFSLALYLVFGLAFRVQLI